MSVLPDSREVFYRLACQQEGLPARPGPPLHPFFHVQIERAFRPSAMGGRRVAAVVTLFSYCADTDGV